MDYKQKGFIHLFGAGLLILNAIDLVSTQIFLSLGKTEINPLLSHLNTTGINLFTVIIKIGAPVIFWVLALILFNCLDNKKHWVWIIAIQSILTVVYLFVVINNLLVINAPL